MKTAAIYDRWLYTLGGGEQVAFGYAQILRDLGYQTTILTHTKIDSKKAETKLDINLRGIKIEYLPPLSTNELTPFTEKYDVFVNTSYLDYFPNRAKIGILSVFFPAKIFISPLEYLKRAFAIPSMRRFFIYPTTFEGFSYSQVSRAKIYKWLGQRSSIILNKDVTNMTLSLYFPEMAFSMVDNLKFYLGNRKIKPVFQRIDHKKNIFKIKFIFQHTKNKRFSIVNTKTDCVHEIALVSITINNFRYILYNWFKRIFPNWEMRLHGGPGITKRSDIDSYDKIITISEFSKKWINKYWGLESEVFYPTIYTSHFKGSQKKKNWIIHVGRFFVTGHCKKQLELVNAFSRLISAYGVQDWELHFVGSVHEGERHRQYFEKVKQAGLGYPVHFHTDVSRTELNNLLSQAKIYWHATGLDENEKTQPILFEHFGITTVEAMASGCVPVVINAGGQKEIVTDDSGFLWNTRDELIQDTLNLIEDEKLLAKLSKKAVERSKYFDKKRATRIFASFLKHIKDQA